MATVVIRPDRAAGQNLRDLIVELAESFGPRAVTAASGGAVVSWEAARDYLAAKLPAEAPAPADPVQRPAGPVGDMATSDPDPAPARVEQTPETPASTGEAAGGSGTTPAAGGAAAGARRPPATRTRKTTRSRTSTGKSTREQK